MVIGLEITFKNSSFGIKKKKKLYLSILFLDVLIFTFNRKLNEEFCHESVKDIQTWSFFFFEKKKLKKLEYEYSGQWII